MTAPVTSHCWLRRVGGPVSFLDALDESELWVGELRQVRLPCGRVLLLRTDAGVFAYEDRCPHLGLPLSAGTLEGDTLTCSAHQFQFDATTGQGKNPSCLRLRAYPVAIEAGVIRVDGQFARGDAVIVRGPDTHEIGRGLVAYDAEDAEKIKGRSSSDILSVLGISGRSEMIHRDDLVIGRADR